VGIKYKTYNFPFEKGGLRGIQILAQANPLTHFANGGKIKPANYWPGHGSERDYLG
jgi:hypothetical protein